MKFPWSSASLSIPVSARLYAKRLSGGRMAAPPNIAEVLMKLLRFNEEPVFYFFNSAINSSSIFTIVVRAAR